MRLFEAKVKKIQNEWFAIMPSQVVKEEKLTIGKKINLAIIKKKKL